MSELRVCVGWKCNFKCVYCSKDGEGIYSDNPELTDDEVVKIVEEMKRIGIKTVRFTGGEPFMRKNFMDLVKRVKAIEGIDGVSVVTNGSLITHDLIEQMAEENIFSYVTVSLDTLNPEKFKKITKCDVWIRVINNIKEMAAYGIKTRVNFVLSKDNFEEIEAMLEFCTTNKVDLKILDLYNNEKEYVLVDKVKAILLRKDFKLLETQQLPGKVGSPMELYEGEGVKVVLKDGMAGTTYSDYACKKCKRYPCQLGITNPVMTHDGIIKVCNLGREMGINCFKYSEVDKLKLIYQNVSSIEKKWGKNYGNN